jgi:hypothetical protein
VGGLVGVVKNIESDDQAHFEHIDLINSEIAPGTLFESNVDGTTSVGGLVGASDLKATFEYVNNSAVVKGDSGIGGLIGFSSDNQHLEQASLQLRSVTNYGRILGSDGGIESLGVGGFIGATTVSTTINSSSNYGNVFGTASVGGFVGFSTFELRIFDSSNLNPPDGDSQVAGGYRAIGGLIGSVVTIGTVQPITVVEGSVNDQTVSSNLDLTSSNIGGIIGEYADGLCTLDHATNSGKVIGQKQVGGLIGRSGLGPTFITVKNDGTVSGREGSLQIGGFVGYQPGGITLRDPQAMVQDGSISGGSEVGGWFGEINITTLSNLSNQGEIFGTGSQIGGLIGAAPALGSLTSATNYGKILGTGNQVGGLIGITRGDSTLNRVSNLEEVNGSNEVGGLVGVATTTLGFNLTEGSNWGTISGTNSVGGLVGLTDSRVTTIIQDSANYGDVFGEVLVSGGIGKFDGNQTDPLTILRVFNLGTISGTKTVSGLVNQTSPSTNALTLNNLANLGPAVEASDVSYSAAIAFLNLYVSTSPDTKVGQEYRWDGVSDQTETYSPFLNTNNGPTGNARIGSNNGYAVTCQALSERTEFWTATRTMAFKDSVWDLSEVANGYVPVLKSAVAINSALKTQNPFYCQNTLISPVGTDASEVFSGNFGAGFRYDADDTNDTKIFHIYPVGGLKAAKTYTYTPHSTTLSSYLWINGVHQERDLFPFQAISPTDSVLLELPKLPGSSKFDNTISFFHSLVPILFSWDLSVRFVKVDNKFFFFWNALHGVSSDFTVKISNPFGGFNNGGLSPILTTTLPYGEWRLGQLWSAIYAADYYGTFTFADGMVKTFSGRLEESNPLVPSASAVPFDFPDVQLEPSRLVYAGQTKTSDIPAMSQERLESIQWLAKFGLTEGAGVVEGRRAFRPQSVVNFGSLAQFLQRLTGIASSQINEQYSKASSKFTDISDLMITNPARYYAILWISDVGLTQGCASEPTKYCPTSAVKRSEIGVIFQNYVGVANVPDSISIFPDVTEFGISLQYDSNFKVVDVPQLSPEQIGSINWLLANGITFGSGTTIGITTYRPQDPVTRGAMAQFMHRIAIQLGASTLS